MFITREKRVPCNIRGPRESIWSVKKDLLIGAWEEIITFINAFKYYMQENSFKCEKNRERYRGVSDNGGLH